MSDISSIKKLADFSDSEENYLPLNGFLVEAPTILIGQGLLPGDKICLRVTLSDQCEGNNTLPVKICGCEICITCDNNIIVVPFPGRFMLKDVGGDSQAKIFRQDWKTMWDINILAPCCKGPCE